MSVGVSNDKETIMKKGNNRSKHSPLQCTRGSREQRQESNGQPSDDVVTSPPCTHLYDIVVWVTGIEFAREGKLDHIISNFVSEVLAVLMVGGIQTKTRVHEGIL